jgi:hypothetical protein
MPEVEQHDLDVVLTMAIVVKGHFGDLIELRNELRQRITERDGRFIFATIASAPLRVVKESDWKRLSEVKTNG